MSKTKHVQKVTFDRLTVDAFFYIAEAELTKLNMALAAIEMDSEQTSIIIKGLRKTRRAFRKIDGDIPIGRGISLDDAKKRKRN